MWNSFFLNQLETNRIYSSNKENPISTKSYRNKARISLDLCDKLNKKSLRGFRDKFIFYENFLIGKFVCEMHITICNKIHIIYTPSMYKYSTF